MEDQVGELSLINGLGYLLPGGQYFLPFKHQHRESEDKNVEEDQNRCQCQNHERPQDQDTTTLPYEQPYNGDYENYTDLLGLLKALHPR